MRFLSLWLATSLLLNAVEIDAIAVVVNTDLIKDSDINRDLLATQMLNGDPPSLTAAARKKDAAHLIDQVFIREEIRDGAYPIATEDQADKELNQLIADRYKTHAELDAALKRYHLTEPDLREQFRWQLTVLNFIDARFRPAVLITDEAVNKYFSQHRAQVKSESDARDILTNEQVNKLLFEWLDQHRKNAKVRYLEAGLA
jgi:hypothetical protein